MEKIWLKEYPPGVPAEIDSSEFASLKDILEKSCRRFADLPAYSNMGATLRYRDIDRLSRDFAAFLQGLGLGKGDRVAIMMPNVLQYPVALFGALRAGLIGGERQSAVHAARTGASAQRFRRGRHRHRRKFRPHLAGSAGPDAGQDGDHDPVGRSVPVSQAAAGQFRGQAGQKDGAGLEHSRRDPVPAGAASEGAGGTLTDVPLNHDDLAFLQYTGGTTGVSKGAMLTHGNMVANLAAGFGLAESDPKPAEETVITALPLYHIFSLTANCLTFMKVGGHNILITNPRDMPGFVKELGKVRFTAITGVNTLFNGLLHAPGFDRLDFSALKLSLGGGMAVQRAVAEQLEAR